VARVLKAVLLAKAVLKVGVLVEVIKSHVPLPVKAMQSLLVHSNAPSKAKTAVHSNALKAMKVAASQSPSKAMAKPASFSLVTVLASKQVSSPAVIAQLSAAATTNAAVLCASVQRNSLTV